jgi:xylan 1,4-beta-xylosidase
MLSRLGDTRVAVESSHAWSLDRLDDGEVGMPGEVDALATVGDGVVAVLLWRHADDQYATATTDTVVTLRLERIPSTLPA